MNPKTQNTILIKWVRSGIGFPYRQKRMVRSLGLRRLNQVVERPDTLQTRGLVSRIAHLVEVVGETRRVAWAGVPEYTISAPQAAPPSPPTAELQGPDPESALP
ncbi:MAG: 50S ribosomal protein L30 [Acidobacteria bacterium]|nr:MAG: 50S ribosomal protein L30 [Acidobacteriota bacterium]